MSAKKPDATFEDVITLLLALALTVLHPFVAAALLRAAVEWHFGRYPDHGYLAYLAAVVVLSGIRRPVLPEPDRSPARTFGEAVGLYARLAVAGMIAWALS